MTGAVRHSAVKELRALRTASLACAAATIAGAFSIDPPFHAMSLYAYCLGSVAVGALSIGHEYSEGTLTLLLTQPVRRRQLLVVKAVVLTAIVMSLGALAWGAGSLGPADPAVEAGRRGTLIALSILASLFVAPFFTMLCRNPMPGAVFTMALPAAIWVAIELLAVVLFGQPAAIKPEMMGFKLAVLWPTMLACCAVCGVLGWRTFLRLQVIEGRGADLGLPMWGSGTSAAAHSPAPAHGRTRHPFRLLAKKELRLQQMTFVVVGLYVVARALMAWLGHRAPDNLVPVLGATTLLYSALVGLLIGSLASAEERQLGTAEWHQLLPIAAWKQWALKTGMAMGLALLLAVGLPALIGYVQPLPGDLPPLDVRFVTLALIATTGSLYISSLSTGGLQAFLWCFPAGCAAYLLLSSFSWRTLGPLMLWTARQGFGLPRWTILSMLAGVLAGLMAVVLRFGLENQRRAERPRRQVWRQGLWIAATLVLCAVLSQIVPLLVFKRTTAEPSPARPVSTEAARPPR